MHALESLVKKVSNASAIAMSEVSLREAGSYFGPVRSNQRRRVADSWLDSCNSASSAPGSTEASVLSGEDVVVVRRFTSIPPL